MLPEYYTIPSAFLFSLLLSRVFGTETELIYWRIGLGKSRNTSSAADTTIVTEFYKILQYPEEKHLKQFVIEYSINIYNSWCTARVWSYKNFTFKL